MDAVKQLIRKIAQKNGFTQIEFYHNDHPSHLTHTLVGKPGYLRIDERDVERLGIMLPPSLLEKGILTLILHERGHHLAPVDPALNVTKEYRDNSESRANREAAKLYGDTLEYVAVRLFSQGRHPNHDQQHLRERYNWLPETDYAAVARLIDSFTG